MATTAICNSFKAEMMQAGHCLNAVVSVSGVTHTNQILDGLSSTAGISRGMAVTGGDVAASTYVADVTSNVALKLSLAASGGTTASRTFTGDALKILLIKNSPSRTYAGDQTNVGTPNNSSGGTPSTSNVGTDDAIDTNGGTHYTAGGIALVNTTPVLVATTTAVATFSNVSWTNISVQATAAIIYNTEQRQGAAATPIAGRAISVHDFGGNQQTSVGTFTLVMPTADQTTGLIRIGP